MAAAGGQMRKDDEIMQPQIRKGCDFFFLSFITGYISLQTQTQDMLLFFINFTIFSNMHSFFAFKACNTFQKSQDSRAFAT